jgi:antitoxin MazE
MKTRVVKIGNSQGVRIPKPLIEQAGLGVDVELEVEGYSVVIRPASRLRQGWSQAFAQMASLGDDGLLDQDTPSTFDIEEGEW